MQSVLYLTITFLIQSQQNTKRRSSRRDVLLLFQSFLKKTVGYIDGLFQTYYQILVSRIKELYT